MTSTLRAYRSGRTWPEAIDDLTEAARDVLDEWADVLDVLDTDDMPSLELLASYMETLRRATFVVRQWQMT